MAIGIQDEHEELRASVEGWAEARGVAAVGTAIEAVRLPSARPGRSALARPALPEAATTPATTAVVSHGPTAAARPSSSATTASSTTPAPCPPRSSWRWMASSPCAARSPQ